MRFAVVTLFPELFESFLDISFVGRARASGSLHVHLEQLREHGLGKHRSVDDTPYGGGSGMVMRCDCVLSAIEHAERELGCQRSHRVLLTPQGRPFAQGIASDLVAHPNVTLICGRYEGFDERVRSFVDAEVSLGDFVLTGGEIPAMAVIEACVRLIPGVLGNADSPREESFSEEWEGLLEYPHYTRPQVFRGLEVPEILRSGHHGRIAEWRRETARARTAERRPDLVADPTAKRSS